MKTMIITLMIVSLTMTGCSLAGSNAMPKADYAESVRLGMSYHQPDKPVTAQQAITYFRAAIEAEPDNPDNIKWEMEIARLDPDRMGSGRKQMEHILDEYKASALNTFDNAKTIDDPSLFLPQTALMLAAIPDTSTAKAKTRFEQCLDMMNEIHALRLHDWQVEPEPRRELYQGDQADMRYLEAKDKWSARQEKAATGLLWDISISGVERFFEMESLAAASRAITLSNIDPAETNKRQERMKELMNELGMFQFQVDPEAYLLCLAAAKFALLYPDGEERTRALTQSKARYPEGTPAAVALDRAMGIG